MKKFISLFLTICMILSLTSAFTFTASAKSDDDIVKIKVTATPKDAPSDDEKYRVPIKGATVNMYKGQGLKGDDVSWVTSDTTDSEGYAEFDLSGYSEEERSKLTFSAQKVVASGSGIGDGIDGGNRDALFSLYNEPRMQLELHSETIDSNGNWLGRKLPVGNSKDVDLAFVIDTTSSMSGSINNVKNNITEFAKHLEKQGLDLRMSVVEYRDIDVDGVNSTKGHYIHYSPWHNTTDELIETLGNVTVAGGGDLDETPIDALDSLLYQDGMNWRSTANKFAFILTDAGCKVNNTRGYSSMQEIADLLYEENIMTSVIGNSRYLSGYEALIKTTKGQFVNINSADFCAELIKLADGIIGETNKELELHLSEPRLLVNLAICYHESDEYNEKESNTYYNSVRNFASNLSKNLAQATDGHLMVNKVLLGKTDRIESFFTSSTSSSSYANMSDIKIVGDRKGSAREWSYVDSDGKTYWFKPLNITQNAYTGGFYTDLLIDASLSSFKNLGKEVAERLENNYSEFERIQLSAYVNYSGNEYNIDEDTEKWSKVATHEAGHYIIGLFDDYLSAFLDGEGNEVMWGNTYSDSNGQTLTYRDAPNSDYGLMDNNLLNGSNDIEISSDRDYLYLNNDYDNREINTAHSFNHKKSAERVFADFLEKGVAYTNDTEDYLYKNVFNISYKSKYSISKADRLADYGFASLSDDDYIWYESGNTSNIVSSTIAETSTNSISAENILFKNSITATTNGVVYKSPYDELHAYFIPDKETTYTISSYDKQLLFDEYFGVNLPFVISSSNEVNTQGELLSTASIGSDIDYSTISWFKIVDDVWAKLDTTLEKEESMNIRAYCDYDGDGTYVLMAKLASDEELQAVTNLDYTNPKDRDSIVELTFDDLNADTVYYNIYYSDKKFSSINDKDVVMEKRYAGSDSYSIDLGERNATGYAAVVAIAENGAKSELSEVIRITTSEADRDGDGIPDWYCDKYSLWPESGEEKDIANSDDDKDGLTNLEEYKGGSDPTDPNDPRKTSKTAVKSVSLSDSSISLSPGGSSVVTAKLNPSDATNKNVKWYVDDSSVATVSVVGLSCDILGIKEGTTKVTVVTEDGGYTDSVTVKVSISSSSVSFKPSGKDYYVLKDVAVSNGYEYFDYPEKKSANIRSASYILAFQDNNKVVSYKTVLGDTGILELDKVVYEYGGKLYVSAIDLQTKLVKYFPNFPTSTPSTWAEAEVARAINSGLVTDSVKVNYQRNITREQFCELVVKLYERTTGKTVSKEDNRFNDTNNPEILKAYNLGIVNGVSKTKFAPYNLVTRQEICAMLVRAVDAMYPNVDINDYQYHSFSDNDKISSWAMPSVQFAYDNDIMKGVGANEILPLGNTTCEQAILLINRIYESKSKFE
ncbi:MAG: S-layer homology domain-containing protein [Clostridia bacterium]